MRGWVVKTLPGGDAPGEVEPGALVDYRREEEEDQGQGGGYPPPEVAWPVLWHWHSVGRVRLRGRSRVTMDFDDGMPPLIMRSYGRLAPLLTPRSAAGVRRGRLHRSHVPLRRPDQTAALLALLD